MVKIIITITAFLISLISLAQVAENREVADFSKLKASQGIEVFYTISNTKSVKVETDDNEKLKCIKTEVENGTLKLYIETNDYKDKKGKKSKYVNHVNGVGFTVLKVTISGPNLDAIKASSSADIKINNLNKTTNLSIEVSSSGSISGQFECSNTVVNASSSGDLLGSIETNEIAIDASSSADIVLSGKSNKVLIKASSSSSCNLKNLNAEEAQLKASSSADIVVNVSKSIEAKASSSADITYYGKPSHVKKEESSSGSVSNK